MSQSSNQNENNIQSEQPIRSHTKRKWLPHLNWNDRTGKKSIIAHIYRSLPDTQGRLALLRSQILLFNSRKKWGLLFALATLSGLFCVPSAIDKMQVNFFGAPADKVILLTNMLLPISTLLIITGMYVLNDLFDADLDRINRKTDRPLPSGKVSERQALVFVVLMNFIGLSIPILAHNLVGVMLASTIALIGILYSLPKISLKDKFIIKTCAIAIAMACSLLLGASAYLNYDNVVYMMSWLAYGHIEGQILYPIYSGLMIALMVFVTSPLNDLGDIKGDKEAGRRTIPIVLGRKNTIRLSLFITLGIAFSSWALYATLQSSDIGDWTGLVDGINISALAIPIIVSGTCLLIFIHLLQVWKRIEDQDFIRKSVSKKSMPLHLLLQISLVIGCLLI
jgi:geranylgeranylglycerol-phosphate geranylgeranyltransferase